MQFSFLPLMAMAATLVSGIAIPISSADSTLSIRDPTSDALSALQNLNTTAEAPLSAIKTTLAALPADASDDQKSAATAAIQVQVAALVSQIDAVTALVKSSEGAGLVGGIGIGKRQDNAIAALVAELIASISGVADSLIASLGLTATLGLLNPLVGSLNGLLQALKNLLDNLLLLVKQIVDQLLDGLSAGLAGLIL